MISQSIYECLLSLSAYNEALKVISNRKVRLTVNVYANNDDTQKDLENFLKDHENNFSIISLQEITENIYRKMLFDDFFSKIVTVNSNILSDLRWYLEDYYDFLVDAINGNVDDRLSKNKMYLVNTGISTKDIILISVFSNFVIINFIEYFDD